MTKPKPTAVRRNAEGSSRIVVLSLDPAMDGHYARRYIRGLDGELADRGHARIALALPDRATPLRDVRLSFANQAAAARGLPEVVPFPIPLSRTSAADSLRHFRAARPEVTTVAAFDDDVALRTLLVLDTDDLSPLPVRSSSAPRPKRLGPLSRACQNGGHARGHH